MAKMKRNTIGKLGEELAADFLKKYGFTIFETNYRCPEGEIDIVARHKNWLFSLRSGRRLAAFSAARRSL